ncbi:hypothetical protein V6N11_043060 [Hibiscus sabdariffa]|uniref:Leucine-rich repeat-containing N-terminal plant-type domain-containing protein n=1 Tax=Hibiscus sabdariffa TaxID=183260 RepID=A0ABR2QY66_9ROSI
MANTRFLLPLTFVLLFATFGGILSVNSPNITTDQSALLALKSRITYDPHNFIANNWSTSTFVCKWIGVICESRHHRVVALNLSGMGLTGTIPSQLGNLSSLARFDISDNTFHGSLPIELANLHQLEYLNFGSNNFEGEIPSWFGYFTELRSLFLHGNNVMAEMTYLSLYNNSLDGNIPMEIGNLTMLNSLLLGYNNLTGPIPSSIFNISSLQEIVLGNNNNLFGHLSSNIFDYLPRLLRLNLVGIQLSGRIPSSLFKCKKLEYLELYDNNLEEDIVPLGITNLTSLVYFSMPKTNLSGRIPRLQPSLQGYGVADNNLVGEIPCSICNLSSLDSLYLSENSLDGKIPECIGNLSSSLSIVELQNNNFHGEIPETFSQGCTLQIFRINNNQVEGSLPRSLVNCKYLNLLDVGNNYLYDTFPNWLGILDRLQVLILRSNRFYGQVDNSNASDVSVSFTHLRVIDLSHNNFSGYLPTKFFENLQAIREEHEKKVEPEYLKYSLDDGSIYYVHDLYFTTKGLEREFHSLVIIWMAIDFSNNQFFGEIPKTLGQLHSLIVLNLSHNSLTGSILSSLGDLTELESLDLSSNKFHGRIPSELKKLGFLTVLNLSQNNLVGPILQGKQFDTFTNDSYMGNWGLCGLPLSKSCGNDEETPGNNNSEDDGDGELNWKFSILMGYGSGFVVGLSMRYIVFTIGKPRWLIRIITRVEQRFEKWYRSKLFG